MKKLVIFVVPLVIITIGFFWWKTVTSAPSNSEKSVRVVINKGASTTQVANKLKDEGVIRNAFAFRFYTQVTGVSRKIQAGQFQLPTNLPLDKVVVSLLTGPAEIWVTIPEGWRREEVVERYISSFELKGQPASNFREQFHALSENQEGKLFPDTYLFPKDASASSVVNLMATTFDSRLKTVGNNNSSLTLDEAIVLASLLERETITEAERPIVAGIILKRLEAGWPLQVDASVQYIIGDSSNWWPILTREDLEINSQYNTYKFQGLPPAPIASPGLSSLEAALNPQESSFWYYIHDPKGKIHYAMTLEEHNANVRKYLGK